MSESYIILQPSQTLSNGDIVTLLAVRDDIIYFRTRLDSLAAHLNSSLCCEGANLIPWELFPGQYIYYSDNYIYCSYLQTWG